MGLVCIHSDTVTHTHKPQRKKDRERERDLLDMIIPIIEASSSNGTDIHRLLSIGGQLLVYISNSTTQKKSFENAILRRARCVAGPFSANRVTESFEWLENGSTYVMIDVRSVEDVKLLTESGLPKNRTMAFVSFDENVSILADKVSSLVSGVYVRVKDTSCVTKDFMHKVKNICGVVVLEDKIVPLSEIKRLNDVHIQVACRCTPEYLGKGIVSCIRSDRPDGLYTTVVVNRLGIALGLVYSSKESVVEAVKTGQGVYYSRSRKGLWRKGATSGATQTLYHVDFDCDGDALRFHVEQHGDPPAFCHLKTMTCWGEQNGLGALEQTLMSRKRSAPPKSYTKRLFDDPKLLRQKLLEEANELSEAKSKDHVAAEAADVFYFAMVACARAGVTLADVCEKLDARSMKIKRRPGNAKSAEERKKWESAVE